MANCLITSMDRRLFNDTPYLLSRYTSVGIAIGYELDGRGSVSGRCKRLFSTPKNPALEPTQPPIQQVLAAVSPGIKRPGREADQSPPSSAKVKNSGAIPPLRHTYSWRNA
jgi:hypothetical protein